MTDLTSVPWRTSCSGSQETLLFTSGDERDDIPVGRMATAALAELVAAEHNAELVRRKAAQRGPRELAEVFTAGIAEGSIVTAREEVMPPHSWVKIGADNTEIYLDSGEPVKFLVRRCLASRAERGTP